MTQRRKTVASTPNNSNKETNSPAPDKDTAPVSQPNVRIVDEKLGIAIKRN